MFSGIVFSLLMVLLNTKFSHRREDAVILQTFKSQQEVNRTPTTSPSTSSTTGHLNDVFIKRFVGRLVTQLGWLEDTQDQRISIHHRRQSKNQKSLRHKSCLAKKRLRGKYLLIAGRPPSLCRLCPWGGYFCRIVS